MATTGFVLHRQRLLALRARLRGMTSQMADNALREAKSTRMPNHMAELGTGNFEQELALLLLVSEKSTLEHVEEAIARIENGSYGRCEACGKDPQVPLAGHPVCCPVRSLHSGRRRPAGARKTFATPCAASLDPRPSDG